MDDVNVALIQYVAVSGSFTDVILEEIASVLESKKAEGIETFHIRIDWDEKEVKS